MSTLEVTGLRAGYTSGDVVSGVSLTVRRGEVVALLGANGAGKTTLAKTIMGLLRPRAGTITVDGTPITDRSVPARVASGLVLVPEGRELFPTMRVEETLYLGAVRRGRDRAAERIEQVYGLFPVLRDRRRQRAETLSGGEQQMLAIGRALMSNPRYLLLDEPSLGLAPQLAWAIAGQISRLRSEDIGVLLIEQSSALALRVCTVGVVMARGAFVLSGPPEELADNPLLHDAYLGASR